MKLIVGLGNPGPKYDKTRHNIGFEALDKIAAESGVTPRAKFNGNILELGVGEEKTILLYPHTYMNNSGTSVRAALDFFKVPCESVLVVCDDFNLPVGTLRFRSGGSAGGQKGLADILRKLGTDEVPRLRIGVGPLPQGRDVSNFVLGKFAPQERAEIDFTLDRTKRAIADWIAHDLTYCMNQYN